MRVVKLLMSAFELDKVKIARFYLAPLLYYEGYDLGSELTLAAWIRHASRTREYPERDTNRVA